MSDSCFYIISQYIRVWEIGNLSEILVFSSDFYGIYSVYLEVAFFLAKLHLMLG